jgi:hypothetical protein
MLKLHGQTLLHITRYSKILYSRFRLFRQRGMELLLMYGTFCFYGAVHNGFEGCNIITRGFHLQGSYTYATCQARLNGVFAQTSIYETFMISHLCQLRGKGEGAPCTIHIDAYTSR